LAIWYFFFSVHTSPSFRRGSLLIIVGWSFSEGTQQSTMTFSEKCHCRIETKKNTFTFLLSESHINVTGVHWPLFCYTAQWLFNFSRLWSQIMCSDYAFIHLKNPHPRGWIFHRQTE
jgi:hypothetical protein